MNSYLAMLRLFGRNVRLALVTAFLIGLTVFGGIYPILLNLYLLRLSYGPEFVGAVNAMGSLAFAICCIPAGTMGTRWGSRRVMIAGLIGVALGDGLLPLAEFVPDAWRGGWLIGMNMFTNLGLALYVVNMNPFLMASTGQKERSHVFSVQAAVGPLAAFIGSLTGGFLPQVFAATLGLSLAQAAPFRYPLLLAALLLLPAIVAMLATEEVRDTSPVASSSAAERSASASFAPYSLIGMMALVIFFQVAGEGAARTFFNVYLDAGLGVSPAQIGLLGALGQLLAVPAALLTPLLIARWDYARTYIGATLLLAAGLLPLALIPHLAAAGVGFMGTIMFASIARPAISVYNMALVAAPWRNWMSAVTTMAVGTSWGVVSFAGGYMIAGWGYASLYLTSALLTTIGALIFWLYFRSPRGEHARPPAAHSAAG